MSDAATAPEGFTPQNLIDPFERFVGPLFDRDEDGQRVVAFRVDERHLGPDGVHVHEGQLMTFADASLGCTAYWDNDHVPCVTLSMQVSFLSFPKLGDLVECRARFTRKTRSVLFVEGDFTVAGEPVMTATSLWKVLGAK
jgi:acyl-coenzyme A thioesterase PaaI-like protein